jgi:hypothetical protein
VITICTTSLKIKVMYLAHIVNLCVWRYSHNKQYVFSINSVKPLLFGMETVFWVTWNWISLNFRLWRVKICLTNSLYLFIYDLVTRPPLWSSGQSSWLQIRRPGLDSRHYRKKNSGSGTGSTQPREYNWGATWQKRSGSCLENREHGRRDPSRWPRGTLYPQKLAITSPTSGGRSVGIVRSRYQTMEFVCLFFYLVTQCQYLGLTTKDRATNG